jgi:hypothetical protein
VFALEAIRFETELVKSFERTKISRATGATRLPRNYQGVLRNDLLISFHPRIPISVKGGVKR